MAIALHDQGRIMVSLGDVAAGHALMDEATVAAVSGELNPFATAVIYCNTIDTCVSVGDYVRAREWTEGAKRWCERQAIAGFPGMCRVHRAGILRLRGAWIEAADEAKRASEELREFNARYYAAALEELGTIRLREGDLMGAAEAFRQTRELGREPEPGQSLLYLAEGKPGCCAHRHSPRPRRSVARSPAPGSPPAGLGGDRGGGRRPHRRRDRRRGARNDRPCLWDRGAGGECRRRRVES